MNNYYLSLGADHPDYPGYVRITAPTRDDARQLMEAHHGHDWTGCFETFDELDTHQRVQRDYLIFDNLTGEALTWTCHICKEKRPDSKIEVTQRTLLEADDAPVNNVRYCIDNDECQHCINAFIEQQGTGFTIPLFLGDMRKPTGLTVFLGVFFDAHHNRRSPFCGNHCPSA
ncbi:hypothetical protein, partial [Endozoicomonas atrinae]|uniref:hypothetical protein n=1 Tax=Endozoicomonas atrinae TaxID=1333660 RepID=UPI000B239249